MEIDNFRNYNVIVDNDNETIIGFVNDIIVYYKNVVKDMVDKGIYETSKELIDLLHLLKDSLDKKYIKETDLVGVFYNDFELGYQYCKYQVNNN